MGTNIRRTDHPIAMVMTRILTIAVIVLLAGTWPTKAQAQATGAREAVVTVKGMQCPFCAYGIKKQLARVPGVRKVDVDLAKNQAIVEFAPDAKPTDEQIQRAVHDAGFTPGKIEWHSAAKRGEAEPSKPGGASMAWREQTATLAIDGKRCIGCEERISTELEKLPGVSLAQVDWQEKIATVRYEPDKAHPKDMIRVIEQAGNFHATLQGSGGTGSRQ